MSDMLGDAQSPQRRKSVAHRGRSTERRTTENKRMHCSICATFPKRCINKLLRKLSL